MPIRLNSNPDFSCDLSRIKIYDLILDNGQFLPYVAIIEDIALFMIVGGHAGVVYFNKMPDFHKRSVAHANKLTTRHRLPFIGNHLRKSWASRFNASLERPPWIPPAPGATWYIW